VDKHPEKLIGFCCVDPNQETASKEIKKCVTDLHMKGLKLGPIYQYFDPRSRKAMQVFETAEELDIPVLIHQGTTFVKNAPLKYAYPSLLDEVANKFGGLKIIVAHLGHPWEDETIALIRKQPNVYADISGLLFRPFRLYMKLMTCIEYGAAGKLVFGSDFPFSTPRLTMNSLRSINRFRTNTGLPEVHAEIINSIIEKNAFQIFSR
jgi:predicted TIM-barrel fold metal-dependent hydrolase